MRYLLLILFVFGCSAGELTDITVPLCGMDATEQILQQAAELEGDELGTVEQALFTSFNGYGALASTQKRCIGTWPNDVCLVPKSKTVKLRAKCDACTAAQFEGFTLGKNIFTDSMNIEGGFSISNVEFNETLFLRVEAIPGSNLGYASASYNTTVTPAANKKYGKTHYCEAVIDYAKIAAWPGLTATQRKYAYAAAFLHEAGHCVGFGHVSDCTGTKVMCTFGPKITSGGYAQEEYQLANSYIAN